MLRSLLLAAIGALGLMACAPSPPSITAITLAPSGTAGQNPDLQLARTLLAPPVPVLGIRPGADAEQSALMLNHPQSGKVSVLLGIGEQNFLLFAPIEDPQGQRFSVAIFLDGESTPALGCEVGRNLPTLQVPAPGHMLALDAGATNAAPTLSAVRHGFRVTLDRCKWPLDGKPVDVVSPWVLQPDNTADQIGVLGLTVAHEG